MPDGYKQEELTIDMTKAHLMALACFLFAGTLFGVPYFLLWRETSAIESYKSLLTKSGNYNISLISVSILLGVILHELIHGITWAVFARKGFKSISFGVIWKYLSPYCHCNEPLKVKYYIAGGIMPGILLGILPLLMSLLNGSLLFFLFGLIFTVAATADFMMVNILRKEPKNDLVQDHPSKVGCFIYRHRTGE